MQFSAKVAIPNCKNGKGKGVLAIAKICAHILALGRGSVRQKFKCFAMLTTRH
jgi:hypothetical protein